MTRISRFDLDLVRALVREFVRVTARRRGLDRRAVINLIRYVVKLELNDLERDREEGGDA